MHQFTNAPSGEQSELKVIIPHRIFEKYNIDKTHFDANPKLYQISYKEKNGYYKCYKIKIR